jgi:hypothetical protein
VALYSRFRRWRSSPADRVWIVPTTPHGEARHPYKIDTAPVPLDLYSEYGGKDGCWYRVPSWRVHFDCEALKGVDVRMHRGIGSASVWTLSEATTGFKMFGDLAHDMYIGDEDAMLAEFAAGVMLRLTPEYVEKAIAKAKEVLQTKTPSPFVARSETGLRVCGCTLDKDGKQVDVCGFHIGQMLDSAEKRVAPSAGLPLKMDTGGGDLEILRMALGNTAACLGDALATFNRLVGEEVFRNSTPPSASVPISSKVPPIHADRIAGRHRWPEEKMEVPASGYVGIVPDKCDRIVWKGRYYHLPIKQHATVGPTGVKP